MSIRIAGAAHQHSRVSNESNINEAAARTASDSAEVATASRRLSKTAQDLRRLIQPFRVA